MFTFTDFSRKIIRCMKGFVNFQSTLMAMKSFEYSSDTGQGIRKSFSLFLNLNLLLYLPNICSSRPKKVVLFLEIGRVKKCLSPTLLRKSNVYENIIFSFKKTLTNKKSSTSRFIRMNLRFFPSNNKNRALCFSTKKSAVRVIF